MVGKPTVHVLISYARDDTAAAIYLQGALERAGANVWLDLSSLSHRDPDWQKSIRKGIAKVQTLIYIASKEAKKSTNVRSEIIIAKDLKKPVICFWFRGAKWMDCATFEVAEASYIDGRRDRFPYGVAQLLAELGLETPTSGSAPRLPAIPLPSNREPGGNSKDQRSASSSTHPPAGRNLSSRGRLAGAQVEQALLDIRVLQTKERIREAIEKCEDLLARSVPRADILYNLGSLYQVAERWWDAINQYRVSLYDPQYAILSCYRLGQCFRMLGDTVNALKYFDDALAQINLTLLEESDADLLFQISYEAARAHRDSGDSDGAVEIFDELLKFLDERQWTKQMAAARQKRREALGKGWTHLLPPLPLNDSRPLTGSLQAWPIDTTDFFAGPGPKWGGADNLRNPSRSGVWPTPPEVPVVHGDTRRTPDEQRVPLDDENTDNNTRPIEIVRPTPVPPVKNVQQTPTKQTSARANDGPADLLEQVIKRILGPDQNFAANTEDMPLSQRKKVVQGVRRIARLIVDGELADACNECIDMITAAPHYLDLYAALAEIYVRQGNIEQATQQYIILAQRCLDDRQVDGAIDTYRRILQLNPTNLSYRTKLDDLLSQAARLKKSASRPSLSPEPIAEMNSSAVARECEQVQEPTLAPLSASDANNPDTSVQTTSPAGIASGEGKLLARSLVDADALPLWIFDDPQEEIQEAIRAMRQIRRRVSSGQLDAAGQLQDLAQLAQRFRAHAQLENAICVLREMVRLAPDDPSVHSELAYLYVRRGQFSEGGIELRVVVTLYEERSELAEAAQVYQRMAEIAWTERRHEDALKLQRQAIRYTPNDMTLRQTIVRYCLEIGQSGEAIEQQAFIARNYFADDKSREAVAALQLLITLDKMQIEAYDMLGHIYLKAAEYKQAEVVYRNLTSVDPNNSLARARLEELAAIRKESSEQTSTEKASEDEAI